MKSTPAVALVSSCIACGESPTHPNHHIIDSDAGDIAGSTHTFVPASPWVRLSSRAPIPDPCEACEVIGGHHPGCPAPRCTACEQTETSIIHDMTTNSLGTTYVLNAHPFAPPAPPPDTLSPVAEAVCDMTRELAGCLEEAVFAVREMEAFARATPAAREDYDILAALHASICELAAGFGQMKTRVRRTAVALEAAADHALPRLLDQLEDEAGDAR
jgi:hypothetical protein